MASQQGELPPNWVEFFTDEGEPYYYNEVTEENTWNRPVMTSKKPNPVINVPSFPPPKESNHSTEKGMKKSASASVSYSSTPITLPKVSSLSNSGGSTNGSSLKDSKEIAAPTSPREQDKAPKKKKQGFFSKLFSASEDDVGDLGISGPTGFKRGTHVYINQVTGQMEGLPQEWKQRLDQAGITQQERSQNPDQIMKVLQFSEAQEENDLPVFKRDSYRRAQTQARKERREKTASMRMDAQQLSGLQLNPQNQNQNPKRLVQRKSVINVQAQFASTTKRKSMLNLFEGGENPYATPQPNQQASSPNAIKKNALPIKVSSPSTAPKLQHGMKSASVTNYHKPPTNVMGSPVQQGQKPSWILELQQKKLRNTGSYTPNEMEQNHKNQMAIDSAKSAPNSPMLSTSPSSWKKSSTGPISPVIEERPEVLMKRERGSISIGMKESGSPPTNSPLTSKPSVNPINIQNLQIQEKQAYSNEDNNNNNRPLPNQPVKRSDYSSTSVISNRPGNRSSIAMRAAAFEQSEANNTTKSLSPSNSASSQPSTTTEGFRVQPVKRSSLTLNQPPKVVPARLPPSSNENASTTPSTTTQQSNRSALPTPPSNRPVAALPNRPNLPPTPAPSTPLPPTAVAIPSQPTATPPVRPIPPAATNVPETNAATPSARPTPPRPVPPKATAEVPPPKPVVVPSGPEIKLGKFLSIILSFILLTILQRIWLQKRIQATFSRIYYSLVKVHLELYF
eukprot:TRINITY_DN2699_c0_g1_i4.p1 TRINITY_DN2699_c0_g1~~TRINITY_DN2699_c0_g1_i4.p1  ORF type:complete len:735 (-),score=309.19 TRINITY_DN2699_c0_g1_i4:1058-3262(-)